MILEKEIFKKGKNQGEPFNENCWKKSSRGSVAGVAQLPWPTTRISMCGVRSTATPDPENTRVGMVQSTRLLPQTFLNLNSSHEVSLCMPYFYVTRVSAVSMISICMTVMSTPLVLLIYETICWIPHMPTASLPASISTVLFFSY